MLKKTDHGIIINAEKVAQAFSWNKGFKEYFAVKANPNPFLINILREYGCGCDCSSKTDRIVFIRHSVGAKKGMNTKLFNTLFLHNSEGFINLFGCHTILCITGIIHNAVCNLEYTARVVTTAHLLRQLAASLFNCFNMR